MGSPAVGSEPVADDTWVSPHPTKADPESAGGVEQRRLRMPPTEGRARWAISPEHRFRCEGPHWRRRCEVAGEATTASLVVSSL